MFKTLTINDNKNILKYYNKQMPNTINKIKKKAAEVVFRKMCKNKYNNKDYRKHLLSLLCKSKMISPNNKNKYIKTSKCKKRIYVKSYTRHISPYYF